MMGYFQTSEQQPTPRSIDQANAGDIGGAQWNNQTLIDEQMHVIARNDRLITRGWLVIILELVVAVCLGLIIYVMAA